VSEKVIYKRKCPLCGVLYEPKSKWQKFCGQVCKGRASRLTRQLIILYKIHGKDLAAVAYDLPESYWEVRVLYVRDILSGIARSEIA
jgi:hypothetical protein